MESRALTHVSASITLMITMVCGQRGAEAAMQRARTTMRILMAAGVLLAGCATERSTIDVTPPGAVPAGALPATKAFVTITRVTDARTFEAEPSKASRPSLQRAADRENPAIRARAVARKRRPKQEYFLYRFGEALADILLPAGRTVEQLVREEATLALSAKGYGVVDAASAAKMNARPLELEIRQYWSWPTITFWTIKLEFEGIVVMRGDMLAGGAEQTVRGHALVEGIAGTDEQWRRTMERGAADLVSKMQDALRDP